MSTTQPAATVTRSRKLGLGLATGLFAIATLIAYLGIRGGEISPTVPPARATQTLGPVVSITLPHEETPLPPGPHREQFQVACIVCHSPRLAFTQPLLTPKKWGEVVHKMVAAYGAPISASDEQEIVAYLSAVHSKP